MISIHSRSIKKNEKYHDSWQQVVKIKISSAPDISQSQSLCCFPPSSAKVWIEKDHNTSCDDRVDGDNYYDDDGDDEKEVCDDNVVIDDDDR